MTEAEGAQTVIEEVLREDQDLAFDLHGLIEELRVKGDGQVRRDGPGGRRPDDDKDLLPGHFRQACSDIGNEGKFYVN